MKQGASGNQQTPTSQDPNSNAGNSNPNDNSDNSIEEDLLSLIEDFD